MSIIVQSRIKNRSCRSINWISLVSIRSLSKSVLFMRIFHIYGVSAMSLARPDNHGCTMHVYCLTCLRWSCHPINIYIVSIFRVFFPSFHSIDPQQLDTLYITVTDPVSRTCHTLCIPENMNPSKGGLHLTPLNKDQVSSIVCICHKSWCWLQAEHYSHIARIWEHACKCIPETMIPQKGGLQLTPLSKDQVGVALSEMHDFSPTNMGLYENTHFKTGHWFRGVCAYKCAYTAGFCTVHRGICSRDM